MSRPGLEVSCRAPGDPDLDDLLQQSMTELRDRYGPQAGSPVVDGAEYHVAYHEGGAVACAALVTVGPELLELKRMYVPSSFRGRGIARELLFCLEEQARGRGVVRLRLQTGTRQPEAISLYKSLGYERVQAWGKYATDPNALCFDKEL